MKKRFISLLTLVAIIATMFSLLIIPANAAQPEQAPVKVSAMTLDTSEVPVTQYSSFTKFNEALVYGDTSATTAFIFYPGGNVSYKDYAPLMMALASKGYLCISIKMPLDYAILNIPAASVYMRKFPGIQNWFIGGHSLGGAMAATHAALHQKDFRGLVLLAAYSTLSIKDNGMGVLCVHGSNDGVLNMDSYEKYRSKLPNGYREYIIPGGNHAQFGDYGLQNGDGVATISAAEQVEQTVNYMDAFFKDYAA